ncbi:MAG: hypothetical protein JWN14_485, partial [Chthonomonadales bacterium]|nr:hypothetical protein [Chthonomonadales bacterium]
DMEIDLTFAQNYILRTDVRLPSLGGALPLYCYPKGSTIEGTNGLLLEITPNSGSPWMGIFGQGPKNFLDGVYACPNGHTLCVVSSGKGYFVEPAAPEEWRVKTEATRFARILPAHNMLLLSDWHTLIAYGAHGFLWKTDAIGYGYSEFAVERIVGNDLSGKVLNYRDQPAQWVDFELNLITGKHKGGVYYPTN